MNNGPDKLPHRFTERAVRRYEVIIATIVQRFPEPTIVTANQLNLSLCTISNRLRDAIRSFREYKWPTNRFDMERFLKLADEIVVSERPNEVVIGFKTLGHSIAINDDVPAYRFTSPGLKPLSVEPYELTTIGKLASQGALSQPVFCRATKQEIELLESNFNVAATLQEDGTYKII